jgi:hypothetical protein
MGNHKYLPAVVRDPAKHSCHLGLPERLKCLLGLLEASDGGPPGRLRKPKQYRDEQEPLRTSTLAEDRNLHVWPRQSEAQCLQKLAGRYRSNLELRKLIGLEQTQWPKLVGELCQHTRYSVIGVDAGGPLTQCVLEGRDSRVKIDAAKHSLKQAPLIEA